MLEKLLVSFELSNNRCCRCENGNNHLRCWGWLPSKLDWGIYIISIAKSASNKVGVIKKTLKTLWPPFMDGFQLLQG